MSDSPAQSLKHLDPLTGAPQTERRGRSLPLWLAWVAAIAMIAMSAFHLWTGTSGAFTAMVQRAGHLAFALGLAFIVFPITTRRAWRWLLFVDGVLMVIAVGCALYVVLLHEQLARRAGAFTTVDLIVAGCAVALVIEATRRSVSPALCYITLGFVLYALLGHWLPGDFGHAPLSFTRFLTVQYYTADGVFGIPLAVSSTFVFLFVLFGAALERTGAGRYLIDLAFATMGRFRGGPAKAAVLASGLMGTISGSSIANTVTTGSLTIPLMKKVGFKPHVAGAVEVAASTNGQLMPPVMGAAAFIMAEMTGIPYSTIIIAALIPAVLSYTVIFTMIHLEAVRTGIQANNRDEIPSVWHTLLRGVHLNIPFVALLVFLLVMWWTPSTAASYATWVTFAVFLLVCLIGRRTAYGLETLAGSPRRHAVGFLAARARLFGVRTLQALRDGAMNMIGIACACACCGIIIGVVAQTGLGLKLTAIIETLSGGALLPALLITAVACILLGIGLPTTATYIIMATLTAPAILRIAAPDQIEPAASLLLATHLFVFYYGILADDTPPVGLCAYAAAGIAGSDPIKTGINSFRLDLAAFLLPLVFFFNRELLLQDVTWIEVLWVLPGALFGMVCFAAALQGYALDSLRWWQRGALVIAAFLLVKPGLITTGVGITVALLAVSGGWLRRQVTSPTE